MKFTYYLEKIAGISVYPLVSLLMFVGFFTIVTLWVLRSDKSTNEYLANLPLENDK